MEHPMVVLVNLKLAGLLFKIWIFLKKIFLIIYFSNSISTSTKWEITNPKHLSGISAIDFFDILADGVADMIVAREDGTVEVYNFETADEPILKYTYVRYYILKY